MKKRILLCAVLVVCVAALCACQSQEPTRYQVAGQATQAVYSGGNTSGDNTNSGDSLTGSDTYTDYDNGTYDPASEEYGEDGSAYDPNAGDTVIPTPEAIMATIAPTIRSDSAGATPVVIDPIDKPTPTPVPTLTFTYQVYDASKLHLSFEGPVGWVMDDTQSDTFILTNPDPSLDYAASVTVRSVSVTSQYTASDLKKEIKQMLDTIGNGDFSSFSPSNTADRTLLDKAGVYANYKGTLSSGVKVAGRVHATCINKVLYTVHVSYPQDMTNNFVEGVYGQLRNTIKITQ